MGVGKKGDITDVSAAQLGNHPVHQGLAEATSLTVGVDDNIPNRGIKGMVRGGTGKTNQATAVNKFFVDRQYTKASFDRFFDFAHRAAGPTDGITQFL